MQTLALLALGLVAGIFSGMFGIGGGLIIVPALMFFFGMKDLDALGTSLAALIPPVGLLGAAQYYRTGHMQMKYAALIAIGLFVGAYFGARIIIGLPPTTIRRLYAGFLLVVAARMLIFGK
jgi:uncharacterized membrane protein YfcA